MKKLITLISVLNLSISSIVPVTSCSTSADKNKPNTQMENENYEINNDAKTQVQEMNIVSMLEEGIDAENILTTNSTITEAIKFLNEKAQNINANITISSQNNTNNNTNENTNENENVEENVEENLSENEKKLTNGVNTLKAIIKNTKDSKDEQKITAKIKNVNEVEIDNTHFSHLLNELFNDPLDGKEYSVLNTYSDALGLIEERVMEIEDTINVKLTDETKMENKLVLDENRINIQFSDAKNNIEKEIVIKNVQSEDAFAKTKDEIEDENKTMNIKSLGHSINERIKNTANTIWTNIKKVGGSITTNLKNVTDKVANAFKKNDKNVEIDVNLNGSTKHVAIAISEDTNRANEITKKLIVNTLNNFPLNTKSLTTNDSIGSIIPIVQSHIREIKGAHEYSLSINSKEKLKKLSTSNRITITFKNLKYANLTFTHTINVTITKNTSKISLNSLPTHIDASKFGFTTGTTWSTIVKYVQTSLDPIIAKNYTIQLVDKTSTHKLKTTDHQFTVLITSKKTKTDKKNFKITISNIKAEAKKRIKGLWDKITNPFKGSKNTSKDKKPTTSKDKKPTTSKDKKPTTSKDKKPTTSKDKKPTTSKDKKPTTSKNTSKKK